MCRSVCFPEEVSSLVDAAGEHQACSGQLMLYVGRESAMFKTLTEPTSCDVLLFSVVRVQYAYEYGDNIGPASAMNARERGLRLVENDAIASHPESCYHRAEGLMVAIHLTALCIEDLAVPMNPYHESWYVLAARRRRICSAQAASSGYGVADSKTVGIAPITCLVGHHPAQGNGPFHAKFHPANVSDFVLCRTRAPGRSTGYCTLKILVAFSSRSISGGTCRNQRLKAVRIFDSGSSHPTVIVSCQPRGIITPIEDVEAHNVGPSRRYHREFRMVTVAEYNTPPYRTYGMSPAAAIPGHDVVAPPRRHCSRRRSTIDTGSWMDWEAKILRCDRDELSLDFAS
ncbi:uncharacterized protein MYCFIDRAFT_179200 [Pseudocercospora fijiensis CIRAD86]|uniref:Uncharacterized protein n=1 Tax=Pseudocercospora fijiensis (strain CIRAD86) TaxID=383855 RepID=M3AKM2_PSEFD|nr:uncharacterized protein MYCFIDRAFT_179200 [Pseudocercospora fijiensis CIRAD86]EME77698.1 hypothetical protein MYCFIDRAFT_179200 [Pseudocercospora fijiensis CIRAD86]